MTIPPEHAVGDGGMQATLNQILVKQGEMGIQLAVISEQLKAVPDHENRLRALERFRFTLLGAVIMASAVTSALGTWVGYTIHH